MRAVRLIISILLGLGSVFCAQAQEIQATVKVNHQQIQGTNVSVFEALQNSLTNFINDRIWTDLQFKTNERIQCTFRLTVNKYTAADNTFECSLLVSATRPVYNSSYTTVTFSTTDDNFSFAFSEFDQLDFNINTIDRDLTALVAYYVYLIIGIDLDTMSPLGGTEYLQRAMTVTNNAQSLVHSQKGWKAFQDSKNRYAILSDYLDGGMEPFRQMQYQYYRQGLDVMAENAERGRAAITEALGKLKEAHAQKPLSVLPQLFTEYKRDEIVNIYKGKANSKEKEGLYEVLMNINASQNSAWRQLKM